MKRVLLLALIAVATAQTDDLQPAAYLTSESVGTNLASFRDQSQEMAKDFMKDCPAIRITASPENAEYTVKLKHIESGLFLRMNQFSVTDMSGQVLAVKETNSIKAGMKVVCDMISEDWSDEEKFRETLIRKINANFQRESVLGYAEIQGGALTIHSERASPMRFHALVASKQLLGVCTHAGVAKLIYTNDADNTFAYDLKSRKEVPASGDPAAVSTDAANRTLPDAQPVLTDPPMPAAEPTKSGQRGPVTGERVPGKVEKKEEERKACLELAKHNPDISSEICQ